MVACLVGEPVTLCGRFRIRCFATQREIHDRQPVVLEQFEPWLTGAAGPELLEPALEDLLQVAGIAQGEPGRQ
jgi:hypothetical protein